MASNSTHINKANYYHLSQQIIEHNKKKKPQHMTLELQAWDRHKHVAGLNRSQGITVGTSLSLPISY
jgi:hypothetical protein